jgi:hypothetical protein
MNLKLSLAALALGLLLGCYIGSRLAKPSDLPAVVVKTASSGNVKATKVTKPTGEVVETLECAAQTSAVAEVNPIVLVKRSKYSVAVIGLKDIEAVQADARLGDLPLFAGGIANKDNFKLSLRWEF